MALPTDYDSFQEMLQRLGRPYSGDGIVAIGPNGGAAAPNAPNTAAPGMSAPQSGGLDRLTKAYNSATADTPVKSPDVGADKSILEHEGTDPIGAMAAGQGNASLTLGQQLGKGILSLFGFGG